MRKALRTAVVVFMIFAVGVGAYLANSLWSTLTAVPAVNIGGVEYPIDLAELDLREFDLTDQDIKPLAELTQLEVLRLTASPQLTDLTPLTNLTGLKELVFFSENASGIENIEMLAGLENLGILRLTLNGVDDFSALAGLTKLTRLDINGAITVKDFDPLQNMTMLQQLEINSENGTAVFVRDLSGLAHLTQLRHLEFDISGLESLSGVEQMSQLKVLRLKGTDSTYTDLAPLQNLVYLEEVHLPMLSPNYIGSIDISGLAGAVNLTSLTIDHNILDLEPLRGLQSLELLSIINGSQKVEADHYKSFEPLRGLHNLTSLSIRCYWYDDIDTNLDPLGDLTNLKALQMEISQGDGHLDLSPLGRLENLLTFTLSGENTVLDWSPVDHVPTVVKSQYQ